MELAECIDRKYGNGTFITNEHDIKRRCNQKCIDVANRLKKQRQVHRSNQSQELTIQGNASTQGQESTTQGHESSTQGHESSTQGHESTTQGQESATQGQEEN